jgi:hypothetical protein
MSVHKNSILMQPWLLGKRHHGSSLPKLARTARFPLQMPALTRILACPILPLALMLSREAWLNSSFP